MESDSGALTKLLAGWREGDQAAAGKLLPLVYEELRRLAAHYMRQERHDHTLQATALVHEMYLKLFEAEPVACENRSHFFALAAQQIRRILVNYARDRHAEKRGGKRLRLSLTDVNGFAQPCDQDLLDVDDALDRLQRLDSRAARVVELRFFAGLSEAESAEALGISLATLKRDWTFGRAWLLKQLTRRPPQPEA